ncbi:MAG: hypothetical protein ACYTFF_15335 [Planctomycetota bacterium]|jgi:hypothetical protein
MRRLKRTGTLGLLMLLAGGCAASPIKAWQAALEEYVEEQGNGDLNVLRAVDRSPSESDFGVIGAKHEGIPFVMPKRTDANGVLLGYRTLDGRGWYVYVVGTVEYHGAFVDFPLDDPRLTDIRLAAVSGGGGSFRWLLSPPDEAAVVRYCEPQLEKWRHSHPSRAAATAAPTTFPTPADDFRLDVAPEAFTVVEEHSRATWTLPLEQQASD